MNEEYYTRKYSFENFRLCKDLDTQGQYGIPIINPVELSEIPQFIRTCGSPLCVRHVGDERYVVVNKIREFVQGH